MRLLLRILLLLQGAIITILTAGIIIVGPSHVFSWIVDLIGLEAQQADGLDVHFIDGTIRAYAVFFLVFGLVVLNIARDFRDNHKLTPVLMSILIIAGCARLWSVYTIGNMSTLTLIIALAEILPAILILMVYFLGGKRERY